MSHKRGLILGGLVVFGSLAGVAANAWMQESRRTPEWFTKGVMYQIQMRAFTEEGTLKAAERKLPYLKDLGVTIVYLVPVMKMDTSTDRTYWSPRQVKCGFAKNQYRIADYFHVDEEFGTDQDLKDFCAAAHGLGLKVLFDLVYLHCGPTAPFLKEHPDFTWWNEDGTVKKGPYRFPKLNFANPGLRKYFDGNVRYLLTEYGADGFRCDVGDGIPLDFWCDLHDTMDAVTAGHAVLLCEGYTVCNQYRGFDADYGWFPGLDAKAVRREWIKREGECPRGAKFVNHYENHDIGAFERPRRESAWGHAQVDQVLVWMFTVDGVPMLFTGNELADADERQSMFKGTPMDWSQLEREPGKSRHAFVKRLAELRRTHPAFTAVNGESGLTWLDTTNPEKVTAFVRRGNGETLLVVQNWSKESVSCDVSFTVQKGSRPSYLAADEDDYDVHGRIGDECILSRRAEKTGERSFRLGPWGFIITPISAFDQEPENQSDGARYEAALRSTRCAQLSARSAPDWFKRGFVYQIQPRAFTPEGTLKAATAKLPLVRESGAGIVYLMPVNVLDDETNQLSRICRELGQPKGFYRTKDYFNTDPEFGTNADRKDFVDECHRLGMKVVFDIVLYHCGPSAVLIKMNPNWVERNPDGSIRLGKWGRPVLNFREQGLREYLYVLLGYLVADVGVDGFRCDVAETQPLDFWEEAHRRLSSIKSDVVLICEGYGCPGEQEKAFDCCYDWKGMEALRGALDGRVPLSRVREEWTVKRTHCERGARFLRYVENHDETDASQNKGPRGDSDERWGRKRMEAALFYCFTSDGVPFLYNGNEFADRSFQRMLLKTPIDWSARDTPEGRERLAFVQRFAHLRQTDAAFSADATLTWVDNDSPNAVLSYTRTSPDGASRWLCAVNLTKKPVGAEIAGFGRQEFDAAEWKLVNLKEVAGSGFLRREK